MTRTKRSFTPEERLSLLQESEREGFMETCRKHNLSPTLLSKWKQRYLAKGSDGLKPAYRRVDPEVRALQDENEKLRRIIANQALELEVKSALLKKNTYPTQEKIAVVKSFEHQGSIQSMTRWLGLPRSSFYYRAHPGPRGMRPKILSRKLGAKTTTWEKWSR